MQNTGMLTTMRGFAWGGERVRLGEGGEGEKSGNCNSLSNNKKKLKRNNKTNKKELVQWSGKWKMCG